MKKILFYLTIFLVTKNSFSQSYYLTSGANGTTQTTCKGQFFSSAGGPADYGTSNGYANNENYTETFCSSTGGQIRANFYWVDLETGFDFLYIYDGPSTASPLIGTLTGSSFYPGVFTSTGTCLTFRFVSDGIGRWGGWDALFGCTPQNCGTNSVASDDCGAAPVICNLNGYCGSTSGWFTRDHGSIEGTPWGGSGAFSCGSIQNNSWISFVASGTTANFNITSSGCSDPSTGIQAVVFASTACTTFTAVSSCQGNGIGTFAVSATGLTAGQTYYIMIDGVDGNDCDYVVQATSGVQTVGITGAGATACVGSAFTLTASATGTGPFTYNWTPAPVSGQGTAVASYTASSSTTYSCTIVGACGSSQTATYLQVINPSPTVNIVGTNTICSAGPGTTLTANANAGSQTITFSNNQDYNIPDNNATGITSTINVTGIAGTVGSALASVCLNINHGFDGDVNISLKCPNGTVINLSDDNGGSGDDYINTCFTNSGGSITLGTAPFTGSFTPEQALSGLSGCTANGTWSLVVTDDAGLDVGTLLDWSLTFNNNLTYSWAPSTGLSSTTSSVVTASPTTTTVYSLTVTDMAGCSKVTNYTVTVNPTPTVAITSTPTNTLCLGASVTFTAATANTYTWTNPTNGGLSSTSGANVSATPTGTGNLTYTVTASSAAGCTTTAVRTITVNPLPTANAGSGGTLTCSTATLGLSGSGGGTYSWSGPGIVSGGSTATPSVNMPGTYSLTVTSAAGCASPVSTVAITQNTVAPTVTSTVSAVLNCTLTSVNASATTTTSPVSYSWSGTGITGGTGTGTITVNQAGTFNYTVTNTANGCKATGSQAVSQNTAAPTVTVSGTQTITCAAPSVTMTGAASPSTCTPVWTGGVSSGANTYTATAASAANYTLTVTNPVNGCSASGIVQVLPSAGFPSLSAASISNSITCTTSTAQAVVTSTTSNVVYSWTGPGITGGSTTPTIMVNAGGTYSLAVTNTISSCTSSITAFVPTNTLAPSPTASNNTTLTCSTTTAVLTGGPASGVTYQWSGPGLTGSTTNSTSIANAPGNYSLIVTSSVNGCTAIATTSVSQNVTLPSPTATNNTTLTCSTTTAVLTGGPSSGVAYQWSGPSLTGSTTNSTAVASGPGTYTLLVTSSVNGCTNTATTNLTQNITLPSPTASNSVTLSCTTTTAVLTGGPSSGVTYQWSGPSLTGATTNSTAIASGPGTYTLLVTSTANGCTNTATTNLTQNITPPSPTASNSTTLTCTTTTANLTASPTSGVTYQWSGPGIVGATTNSNVVADAAGTYTVLVTSAVNGCTNSAVTTLTTNYSSPNTTASSSTTLTCGTTTATVNGGPAAGVTYQWSGPGIVGSSTNQNITVNAPGTYVLVATSAVTGCTNSAQAIVSNNITPPSPTASNNTTLTCSTTTAALTASPTTGVSYQWSGPGLTGSTTNSVATANSPGTYSLIVTSTANSCTNIATTTVSQNTVAPSVSAIPSASLNCTTTTVNVTASTTTTPVSYNWSGTGITSATNVNPITVNQSGVFTYTITDTNNNCKTTSTVSVTQNTVVPIVTMPSTQTITCAAPTVTLVASANPSTSTVVWSGGVTSGVNSYTATASSANVYTLTATDPFNGCSSSGTVQVSPSAGFPTVMANPTTSLSCSTTTAQVVATTTTSPVTYNWSGPGIVAGSTTASATVNAPGQYTVVVTNTISACSSTVTASVIQNTVAPTVVTNTPSILNCTLTSVDAIASTTTSPVSFNWTGSGITGGASTGTITVNQPGTFNYTVTNTGNNCSTSGSVAVTQNTTTPVLTMPVSQTITCASPTVTMIASANPSTCTPVWSGGVDSGANSYTATATAANIYTLTVTDPANGCVASGTTEVIPSAGFPVVTTNSTNSISCVVFTADVVASTTTTPVSYSWTGPGVVSGANTPTATVNAGGQYTVVVTNTLSACSVTMTQVVASNTFATMPSASFTGSVTCLTPTITIDGSPTSGLTYTWTGTGIVGSVNSQSVDVNQGGVYTLSVTNTLNGCVASTTVSVPVDNIVPTVTLTPTSYTTTCATPTVQLSATTSPSSGVTYTWTAPAGGTILSGANAANPIINGSGIFTLEVTNSTNGCTTALGQNTVEIVPDAGVPTVSVSATSLSITCTTTLVTSAITSTNTTLTYAWNPSPLTGGANPEFDAQGVYTATITASNGCSTFATINVALDNVAPLITITPNQTLTCSNPSVTISTTVTPASVSYTWSGPAIVGGVNSSSVDVNGAGDYTVVVLDAANGCSATATSSVSTNNAIPSITITPSNTVITCANPTVSLNASSNSTLAPIWSTPTGTASNPVLVTVAGDYTVTVSDDVTGCSNTQVYTIGGNTVAPTPILAVSAAMPCGSVTVALSASSTPSTGVNYSWTGPNAGSVVSGSNTANPVVQDMGTYTLTVSDVSTGCTSTATIDVIQGNVVAAFTANPVSGIAPLDVTFTDGSTGANSFSWTFGDGNSSSLQNPVNTFSLNGTYTVTLIASSGMCSDTAYAIITVEDGLTLYIPNVFTPNNDGTNDVFTIKSTGVKEISLQIFNRWGEKLYEFAGDRAAWDGKVESGASVPEGTYFYFVKAVGFDGKEIEQNGTLTLFR